MPIVLALALLAPMAGGGAVRGAAPQQTAPPAGAATPQQGGGRWRSAEVAAYIGDAGPGGLSYIARGVTSASYEATVVADVDIFNTVGRRVACGPREIVQGMHSASSASLISPEVCQFATNTWQVDGYTGRVRKKFQP